MFKSFRETYSYPLWMPFAFVLLCLGFAGSILAAFYTMNIRWFLATAVIVILTTLPAKGQVHEHHSAAGRFYKTWMMPDAPKTSCCSDQDCAPAASRFVNDRWEAQDPAGDWVLVPAQKVEQNRDSPDGRSHLCGRKAFSGFTVLCFIRGGGT